MLRTCFSPYPYAYLEYPAWHAQAEGQKVEQKQVAAERQVLSKLEKIKLDQEQRAAVLLRDAQAEELQVRSSRIRPTAGRRHSDLADA